jgi:hypothetical protein
LPVGRALEDDNEGYQLTDRSESFAIIGPILERRAGRPLV